MTRKRLSLFFSFSALKRDLSFFFSPLTAAVDYVFFPVQGWVMRVFSPHLTGPVFFFFPSSY